ncbi:MAG: hypothetical protein CFE21_06435 [Bacteroidetes bacterium B1(2017)]|nr:MAG: hypothetical protein CFE21_06435 [Bacteroidetes bacterium B1(2017)]
MKKTGFVIVLLIALLVLLLWLSRDDDKIPHVLIKADTSVVAGPAVEGGNASIIESSEPKSMRLEVKAEFIGKPFAKCMEIVYQIPNSTVDKMENNSQGVSYIDCVVKGVHRILYFDNGICTSDEIQKK